jgi:hypothetical protein
MHHAAKSNAHNIATLLKHINREKLSQIPEAYNQADVSGYSPVFHTIVSLNLEMF